MTDPKRRRRRPAISCTLCRQRKIRCNRENPCSNCVRSRGGICMYDSEHDFASDEQRGTTPTSSHSSKEAGINSIVAGVQNQLSVPSGAPAPAAIFSVTTLSSPQDQTSTLYAQPKLHVNEDGSVKPPAGQKKVLQKFTKQSNPNIETTISRLGGSFHIHRDEIQPGEPQSISRSVSHKTRLFGQSHWFNTIYLVHDVIEMLEPHLRNESSTTGLGLVKRKALAKAIKLQRLPSWPTPPTNDLPPKNVADELVDCYVRTIECIHRILHLPSFKKDYEALWLSGKEPDTAFMVQLKLVLAIGATTYDNLFSLRASAIRWVYEAQTWLASPRIKSRLGTQTLQTNILLIIAQETADVDADATWIATGTLLRRAVQIGLHRDPASLPRRSSFGAEMHRRLWNTTLELVIQSSLTSGGPPLISLFDFDTQPPGNFDDDQLLIEDSVPKPDSEYTQTSIAIGLRKLIPARLAIVKFLNDVRSSGSYNETLRLDAGLRTAYKTVRKTLSGYTSGIGPSPSQYETQSVDFLFQRYLSSLHIPFFGPALRETTYAFSRKVVVETSLKTWYTLCPSMSTTSTRPRDATGSENQNDLERIAMCGSGLHRKAALQSGMLITVELKTQLLEEDSPTPVLLRPDLLAIVDEVKAWTLQCIIAGETSMKGYLFLCIFRAQIQGIMQGAGKEELVNLLVEAAEGAQAVILPIFEGLMGTDQIDFGMDDLQQMPTASSFGIMDDWDFMMADGFPYADNMNSMGWMQDGQSMQDQPTW